MPKGIKFDQKKLRLELISADALKGLAKVLTYGANKYESHNWMKGIHFSRLIGAILRHLCDFINNEDYDKESGLFHLDHIQCCVMFLSHYIHNYDKFKKFDDRVDCYGNKKTD